MTIEDQQEELEAIEAIYPDDYTLKSSEVPISFSIVVRSDDEENDGMYKFIPNYNFTPDPKYMP